MIMAGTARTLLDKQTFFFLPWRSVPHLAEAQPCLEPDQNVDVVGDKRGHRRISLPGQ